jgi:hypothetical protein
MDCLGSIETIAGIDFHRISGVRRCQEAVEGASRWACAGIDGGFDGQDAAGHDVVEGARNSKWCNLQVINNTSRQQTCPSTCSRSVVIKVVVGLGRAGDPSAV